MLRRITPKQFFELMAFEELEPQETVKEDWRMAAIRQMIFNMAVEVKSRKEIKEFLLNWNPEETKKAEKQPWQMKKAIAYAICAAYGAGVFSDKHPELKKQEAI